MRCELTISLYLFCFAEKFSLCSFCFPLLILNFTLVFPTADFIPETIKQMLLTLLKVELMKDKLLRDTSVCFHFCCICVRYTYIFSCKCGILLVCKPCSSSVTNALCIPSRSTDLNPQKNKWFWKPQISILIILKQARHF